MEETTLYKWIRNRWAILAIFVLVIPVAYKVHQQTLDSIPADWPTTIVYLMTGALGLFLALTPWEDQ